MNPALAGRAFLFFAYPGQISGDAVWVAADGFSGATALSHGQLVVKVHYSTLQPVKPLLGWMRS